MFLGGNTNIPAGTGKPVSLNRDELASIAGALGDGYFGDKGYWREILITFASPGIPGALGQKVTLKFKETDSDIASFSDKAMTGDWMLRTVTIVDRDNGTLCIEREELPNSELYKLIIE